MAEPPSRPAERPDWRATLDRQLPLLGHRNCIVVADAAYPWQTSPGIETVATGADHLTVLAATVGAVARAAHVRAIALVDAELAFVDEAHAPGIGALRVGLTAALDGVETRALPHEDIIRALDEAGRTFHVLLLKTTLALPYTSVFLQLDCGYWSGEAEVALRERIAAGPALPAARASGRGRTPTAAGAHGIDNPEGP
jgi:hypothetical protein